MSEGPLRVISNKQLTAMEAEEAAREAQEALATENMAIDQLAAHIKKQYEHMRWHRTKHNLQNRYIDALRTYNGKYSPDKLAQINQFGGSNVYARLTTTKCRAATALLRDVYLGGERPWNMEATPVPDVPSTIQEDVQKLVAIEAQQMAMVGEQVDQGMMGQRTKQLMQGAARAAKQQADDAAKNSAQKVEDILIEGGFYSALREFLVDLPIFPFACIKGPEVKNVVELKWVQGKLQQTTVPKMFWRRVSPFDLYMSASASSSREADIIERIKITRADLNQMIGIKGYDEENIRAVLREYEHGLQDWLDESETERADEECKEDPHLNRDEMIDTLEYHGRVKGAWLIDYGFTAEQIPDPDKDYAVAAWLIGRFVIKVHINPNPKQRHPYYTTSFEKVPGSSYGNSIPEIIGDLQDVANATLRSLVNNMSISSGPQVMVNEERLSPTVNADNLYPWKRWRFVSDPMGDTTPPVSFFQPESNATELLGVYAKFSEIADEVSSIPRYVTGSEKVGGAASTASGLSMLMNNVSKALQTVAASIDDEILTPLLKDLYEMILLTDPPKQFAGDSQIQVRGVAVAVQKETERMRKLEFLQMTANPIDMQIIGTDGRAAILSDVAEALGMPGDKIVPTPEDMKAEREQQQLIQQSMGQAGISRQQQLQREAGQAQGGQAPAPQNSGSGHASEETDNMHRTNP